MKENLTKQLPFLPDLVNHKIVEYVVGDFIRTQTSPLTNYYGSTSTRVDVKCFEIDKEMLEVVQDLYEAIRKIYNDQVMYEGKREEQFTEAYYYFFEDSILESISSLFI